MPSNIRTLTIRWLSDTSGIEKGAKKASGALGSIGQIAGGVFGGNVATAGAEKLVGFLEQSAKAASEDESSQKILAKTLQNTAGAHKDTISAVEKYIAKTQDATGVTDDKLRPALGTLVRATHDAGLGTDLLNTSLDVSAGTGKDVQTVALALAKAYGGNVGALKRLGVNIDATKAKSQGFSYVQDKLNQTFGGQAAVAADTSEGKMRRLQARYHEVQEQVGAKLMPVFLALGDWLLNKLPQAVDKVVTWFQTHWPQIEHYIKPLEVFFQRTFSNIEATLKAFKLVLQGIIEFVQGVFSGNWGKAWDGIKKIFHGMWDGLKAYLKQWWNELQNIVLTGLKLLLELDIKYLKFVFNTWWTILTSIAGVIAGWVTGVYNKIKGLVTDVVNFFTSIPGKALDGLKAGADAVVTWAETWGGKIGGAVSSGITGAVTGLASVLGSAIKGALNAVIGAWNRIDIGIHLKIPKWVPFVGGNSFDINDIFPDLPTLATGGITRGTGLALLHPNELVAPLPSGGVFGNTYNISVNVGAGADPVAVGRATVDAIRAYEARNGTGWRSLPRASA
jgi:hypothetical protein